MKNKRTTANPAQLSERRKGDREQMAAILARAMVDAGAVAKVEPSGYDPKRVNVKIEVAGGAYVNVYFNGGSSQPDVHVVTWNGARTTFFNPDMGDVDPRHFGEATRVCRGLDSLVATLRRDVEAFLDGSGYLGQDDPRIVAMREVRSSAYRELGWTWPTDPAV